MTEYPHHPVAALFPEMDQEALAELAADIKRNGLLEPIVLADGAIVDGRSRQLACARAKVEPRFEEWPGAGSLVEWVVSRNLYRRHLSTSQRAMVAAKIMPALKEEAKLRKISGKKDLSVNSRTGRASEIAARAVGIGETSVEYGSRVLAKGVPELQEEVTKGKRSVSAAARIAGLSPEEQIQILEKGEEDARRAFDEEPRKIKLVLSVECISLLKDLARQLDVTEAAAAELAIRDYAERNLQSADEQKKEAKRVRRAA
jgi:hypothetical protein